MICISQHNQSTPTFSLCLNRKILAHNKGYQQFLRVHIHKFASGNYPIRLPVTLKLNLKQSKYMSTNPKHKTKDLLRSTIVLYLLSFEKSGGTFLRKILRWSSPSFHLEKQKISKTSPHLHNHGSGFLL